MYPLRHDWPEGSYLLRLDADSGAQRFVPLTMRLASTGRHDPYNAPTGPADYDNRALAVSLGWPYDLDGAHLFRNQERKLVQLAERLGQPLAYQTSMDLAAYPRCSDACRALAGEHGLPGCQHA